MCEVDGLLLLARSGDWLRNFRSFVACHPDHVCCAPGPVSGCPLLALRAIADTCRRHPERGGEILFHIKPSLSSRAIRGGNRNYSASHSEVPILFPLFASFAIFAREFPFLSFPFSLLFPPKKYRGPGITWHSRVAILMTAGAPEPEAEVRARREAVVPVRTAQAEDVGAPTAPAQDPIRAGAGTGRIGFRRCTQTTRTPIITPLPDIPRHVVKV